jgi:tetratricopeptide (TPR) repeat protein
MNRKILQRILVLLFGLAFVGSTGFMLISSIFNSDRQLAPQSQNSNSPTSTSSVNKEQIQAQIRGYEKVLAREPNNPIALQGLVQARLAINDLSGAIPPLEKLVELYPEEENIQALLNAVKQQLPESQQPKQ